MKPFLFPAFLLILSFCACAPRYQLYNITSSDATEFQEDDIYFFSNDDLEIHYDFWTEGGVVLFSIYNKTEKPLYFPLDNSYFILNRDSVPYYMKPLEDPVASILNPGSDTTAEDSFTLEIPPKGNKSVEGFPMSYEWFQVQRKNGEIRTFEKSKSPFVFKNHLIYSFEEDLKNPQILNNEFWVSDIQKMKKMEFKEFEKSLVTKSDKYYVRKSSFFWLDATRLGIIALLIFGAVI
ncbi:MAG: hypothetical protein GY705_28840 [Bacteroidetes bacterium]|nr:hypothetical protein [Bacteroidota bacterium]